jgi:hypothetical protein
MDDAERKLNELTTAAGKALGDASEASNKVVQDAAPGVLSWVKDNQWAVYAFVGLVAVLFIAGLASKGML